MSTTHEIDFDFDVLPLVEHCTPTINSEDDCGVDLRCRNAVQVPPLSFVSIPLGIKAAFPPEWQAVLFDRSGISKRNGLFRAGGVIEGVYRGEWEVIIHNPTRSSVSFNAGDRVCQVLFFKKPRKQLNIVSSLTETERGENGFGSSGVE